MDSRRLQSDQRLAVVDRSRVSQDQDCGAATARGFTDFAPHLDPVAVGEVIARRAALLAPARGAAPLDQALYYDLKSYLPPILMRQDKMSMAHAVETRVPFLDNDLVDFALRVPVRYKLRNVMEVSRLDENEATLPFISFAPTESAST